MTDQDQDLKVGDVVSCKLQFDKTIFWIATKVIGIDDGCILVGSKKYEFRMGDEGNSWIRGIHPFLRDPEMARLAGEVERYSMQDDHLRNKIARLENQLGWARSNCEDSQKQLDAANAELYQLRLTLAEQRQAGFRAGSENAQLKGELAEANAELEKVREGFEKWCTGKYGEASIQKYGNGTYFYASTAAAWEVWQAATEAKQGDGWLSPNRMKGSTK